MRTARTIAVDASNQNQGGEPRRKISDLI